MNGTCVNCGDASTCFACMVDAAINKLNDPVGIASDMGIPVAGKAFKDGDQVFAKSHEPWVTDRDVGKIVKFDSMTYMYLIQFGKYSLQVHENFIELAECECGTHNAMGQGHSTWCRIYRKEF